MSNYYQGFTGVFFKLQCNQLTSHQSTVYCTWLSAQVIQYPSSRPHRKNLTTMYEFQLRHGSLCVYTILTLQQSFLQLWVVFLIQIVLLGQPSIQSAIFYIQLWRDLFLDVLKVEKVKQRIAKNNQHQTRSHCIRIRFFLNCAFVHSFSFKQFFMGSGLLNILLSIFNC